MKDEIKKLEAELLLYKGTLHRNHELIKSIDKVLEYIEENTNDD